MDDEFNRIVAEFVGSLEQVFHHDWDYTRLMMGIPPPGWKAVEITPEEREEMQSMEGKLLEAFGISELTTDDMTATSNDPKPTFLRPQLSEDEEEEDWGSRGRLLRDYRRLLAVMKERKLEPIPPFAANP